MAVACAKYRRPTDLLKSRKEIEMMMTQEVIATVGIPACGKSTWAEQFMKCWPDRYVRVERDIIRTQNHTSTGNLWDYKFSKGRENAVTAVQHDLIRVALDDGKSVIISDTNLNVNVRRSIRNISNEYGIEADFHPMDEHFHVCMKRNANRPNHVPEAVMISMQNRMRHYMGQYIQTPEAREQTTLDSCVIMDIDGTLANMKGVRGPFDWDKVHLDAPIKFVVDYAKYIYHDTDLDLILFSGRDGKCMPLTKMWLQQQGITHNGLYMRPTGSTANDSVIKETLFNNHIHGVYEVDHIVDDRKQVCVHWESMGFRVMNVGGFSSDF